MSHYDEVQASRKLATEFAGLVLEFETEHGDPDSTNNLTDFIMAHRDLILFALESLEVTK